jgi:hypothetical protein
MQRAPQSKIAGISNSVPRAFQLGSGAHVFVKACRFRRQTFREVIGTGIAMGLGAAGAAVVVNYASSKEGADRVVAEISGKAIAVQADVSKADHVACLFAEAIKAFGSVNVLSTMPASIRSAR